MENIYKELEKIMDEKNSNLIFSLIDSYSEIINDYIKFLIMNCFNGDKKDFVNGELFKSFIDIINSSLFFKINIIKIQGFLDFLINCISYININNDFIMIICEIFDKVLSSPQNGLKYNYDKNFKMIDFMEFLQKIKENKDFNEIIQCIKLIQNMKNFYANKNQIEIYKNTKDLQILFASGNIFNSICENLGYIFIIPDLDEIVQDIYFYFINLKIYKINQIFLSSFVD